MPRYAPRPGSKLRVGLNTILDRLVNLRLDPDYPTPTIKGFSFPRSGCGAHAASIRPNANAFRVRTSCVRRAQNGTEGRVPGCMLEDSDVANQPLDGAFQVDVRGRTQCVQRFDGLPSEPETTGGAGPVSWPRPEGSTCR